MLADWNTYTLIEIDSFSILLKSSLTFETYSYCITGLILDLRPANERRRCKVTLIGWAQT